MSKLLRVIDRARRECKASLKDLTVLSPSKDPYRICDGIDARWFREQLDRFAPNRRLHLRGLHYRIVAASDVKRPNGKLYVNNEECWNWLADDASKAARWLGLVPFARIVDERNAPPLTIVPEDTMKLTWRVSVGDPSYDPVLPGPPDLEDILPEFQNHCVSTRQPRRVVLIGEKASLADELMPIAKTYGAELILPTGEISDTMVAEIADRAAKDDRRTVVLYHSDYDPAGRQMPLSVSRKLQALRDLYHPDLDIEVHHVALTRQQVEQFNLPSTPLKDTEKRADKWREVMGREQTEIDALLALHPGALGRIVKDAIAPFYDPTLRRRAVELMQAWLREAKSRLEQHPGYADAMTWLEQATDEFREAIELFEDETVTALEHVKAAETALKEAQDSLLSLIGEREGTLDPPEPEISAIAPGPLFASDYETDEGWRAATLKLKAYKAMEDE